MLLLVGLVAVAVGCAPLKQPPLPASEAPGIVVGGKYVPKVDNFQVILDASLSMDEAGNNQFTGARNLVSRINQAIPTDLQYQGGLRSFGHSSYQSDNPTELLYGMTNYQRAGFHEGLGKISYVGGTSPLAEALLAAGRDLETASGKSALIIVSDGLDMAEAPAAAELIKAKMGDKLCIYTIAIGYERNGSGHDLLEKVAAAGQCGFATTAAKLADDSSMSAFINNVFLAEPPPAPAPAPAPPADSDGDGVPDHLDKCPGTPAGVKVDAAGCPIDTDGDGVADYLDQCPGTPAGVRIDADGCPTVLTLRISFEHDSAKVATEYDSELAKAATCINNYPGHEVIITGHTDSTGSAAYNQRLSEQRAAAVKNALVERFNVPTGKMTTRGYGEERPVADNNTAAGRELNRRVEVACGAEVN
jgi:OOP family OmpA-OmpF porin